MQLIENLALTDSTYCDDYDRSNMGTVTQDEQARKDLKVLRGEMDQLLQLQKKQVHYIGEYDQQLVQIEPQEEFVQSVQEEVNYVGGQGNYNQNFNYRNQNTQIPQRQNTLQDNFQNKPQYIPQGNYQQKPFYNNQQGNFQQRAYNNPPPGFYPNKGNQQNQGQGSSSNAPPTESSTDFLLKQLLASHAKSDKRIEDMDSKITGSY